MQDWIIGSHKCEAYRSNDVKVGAIRTQQILLIEDIVPDYDREKSEWKIVSRIDVPFIDWARRATACIDSVPIGRERDVYKAFLKYDIALVYGEAGLHLSKVGISFSI